MCTRMLTTNVPRRVKKTSDSEFTLLIASAQEKVSGHHVIEIQGKTAKLTIEYGDFSGPLSKAVAALKEVMWPPLVCLLHRT